MPVGDRQAAFAAHAVSDGVHLQTARVPWLNWRGHFGLPHAAESMTSPLQRIFEPLGGDPIVLSGRRPTSLPGDFIHADSGTLIEFDEFQHFASHRLATFAFYPDSAPLGFDRQEYENECRKFASRADRYRCRQGSHRFRSGRATTAACIQRCPPRSGHRDHGATNNPYNRCRFRCVERRPVRQQ